MIARWPSFTAALLTSVTGLLIALDPHTWVTPAVGWIGVTMVVFGGGLALVAGLLPRLGQRADVTRAVDPR